MLFSAEELETIQCIARTRVLLPSQEDDPDVLLRYLDDVAVACRNEAEDMFIWTMKSRVRDWMICNNLTFVAFPIGGWVARMKSV